MVALISALSTSHTITLPAASPDARMSGYSTEVLSSQLSWPLCAASPTEPSHVSPLFGAHLEKWKNESGPLEAGDGCAVFVERLEEGERGRVHHDHAALAPVRRQALSAPRHRPFCRHTYAHVFAQLPPALNKKTKQRCERKKMGVPLLLLEGRPGRTRRRVEE
jgi:hypothetical protein